MTEKKPDKIDPKAMEATRAIMARMLAKPHEAHKPLGKRKTQKKVKTPSHP